VPLKPGWLVVRNRLRRSKPRRLPAARPCSLLGRLIALVAQCGPPDGLIRVPHHARADLAAVDDGHKRGDAASQESNSSMAVASAPESVSTKVSSLPNRGRESAQARDPGKRMVAANPGRVVPKRWSGAGKGRPSPCVLDRVIAVTQPQPTCHALDLVLYRPLQVNYFRGNQRWRSCHRRAVLRSLFRAVNTPRCRSTRPERVRAGQTSRVMVRNRAAARISLPIRRNLRLVESTLRPVQVPVGKPRIGTVMVLSGCTDAPWQGKRRPNFPHTTKTDG
jgi:hypothetical protein